MRPRAFLSSLRRNEKGSALVETALTMPVLFTLVLGAVEFTRVAYTSLELVSAARAGVSYGAETGGTAADLTGITYAAQTDAAQVSGINVSAVPSYVCSDGTASTGLNTDCSNSHIEETLTVQTSVTMDPLIHVPGLPRQYTITGSASQVCLQ